MPSLLTDSNGIPVPQYLNDTGSAYEAIRGTDGAFKTKVMSIATGDTVIGKVKNVPLADSYRYLSAAVLNTDTAIWTPNTGKAIVLKGIRIQNLSSATGAYDTGLGTPDITAFLKVAAAVLAQVKLLGHHIISDTTNHVFMVGGEYGIQDLLFNDGLKLPIDAVLSINADSTNVTVTAWGYEE